MNIDSKKLMLLMAKKGMNFKDLAEKSNVSRATISYANNGKRCRADVIGKIAAALEVEPEAIIED